MTVKEMLDLAKNIPSDEFLKFARITEKLSGSPDLHAFILLDRLVPGSSDIVCAAEHDEIFLGTPIEKLAAVITEDQLLELRRCGVRFDDEGLRMFV